MPDMSGHAILKIVKGVQKIPGDASSAEQGLDEINLLDPNGFACDEYDMKLPALKSSAVYADSPLTDGRTLISGTLGNVTETIRLQLSAGAIIQMAAMLSKLGRFKQDCNDFWDTFGQIEPVYIKHQVVGEPGPRYALLYDIDIDPGQQPLIPSEAKRTVTLVIEREYGWRGLAPGDNPKRWTIEQVMEGQKWNSANADLLSGNNHLAVQAVQNRMEWNTTETALLSQNFMDIPATAIPGDLPALVEIAIQCETVHANGLNRIYIGKSSKPDLLLSGTELKPSYILVAADGTSNTDATDANDTGAPIEAVSGVNRRKTISFATATLQNRITWGPNQTGTSFVLSSLRGRYMAFIRARLSAASTVTMNLYLQADSGSVTFPSYTLTGVGSGGVGNTTFWQNIYMGIVTFPHNEQRVSILDNGRGIDLSGGGDLILQAERTGAATNLYVADLILVPIDEGVWLQQSGEAIGINSWFYDNTGYYLHGRHGGFSGDTYSIAPTEQRGSEFYLTPGQRNRLVMFADLSPNLAGTEAESGIDAAFRFRVNIVPRWSGLRDI